jgi:hypothetical protein
MLDSLASYQLYVVLCNLQTEQLHFIVEVHE